MTRWSTRSLELQNAWSALLVGITLLIPVSTFGTSTTLIELERFLPEWAWGVVFALLGLAQIIGVVKDIVVVRRLSAALLGILFAVYVTTLFYFNPASFGASFVLPMAVGQAWSFFQARRVV